ncbi:MAG: hypothetical protein IT458_08215 [Planctomycetes bacterium]|nr:hypothetical protein [Planctomycetota bacterium]
MTQESLYEVIEYGKLLRAKGQARVRVRHFAEEVILAATTGKVGEKRLSALGCPKWIAHKPCLGWLLVVVTQEYDIACWLCTECRQTGVIRGWKGTEWDLRGKWRPGRVKHFRVPCHLYEELRELAHDDPELRPIVFAATADAGEVLVPVPQRGDPEVLRWLEDVADMVRRNYANEAAEEEEDEDLEDDLDEDLAAALGIDLEDEPEERRPNERPRSGGKILNFPDARMRAAAPAAQSHILRISVRGAKPPVLRRVVVPSWILLADLDRVIRATMGLGEGPFEFRRRGEVYAGPGRGPATEDSSAPRLAGVLPGRSCRMIHAGGGGGAEHDVFVESLVHGDVRTVNLLEAVGADPSGRAANADAHAAVADADRAPATDQVDVAAVKRRLERVRLQEPG